MSEMAGECVVLSEARPAVGISGEELMRKILEKSRRVGECLVWQGGMTTGKAKAAPLLYIGAPVKMYVGARRFMIGAKKGQHVAVLCGEPRCIEPKHMSDRGYVIGTVDEQIAAKLDKREGDGCWVWRGCFMKRRNGDPQAVIGARPTKLVRRYLWPEKLVWGDFLRRVCDEPRCVRPEHMTLGMSPKMARAKKLRQDVLAERRRGIAVWRENYTYEAIGKKLGITRERVRQILQSYKDTPLKGVLPEPLD